MLAAIISFGAAACTDSEESTTVAESFSVSLERTGSSDATFTVTSSGMSKFAYVVYNGSKSENSAPSAQVVFATAQTQTPITTQSTTCTINGFSPLSTYTIYFAAQNSNATNFYKDVIAIEITTQDVVEEVTISNIDYASFDVNIKFPESVLDGNVLKWGVADHAIYNNGQPDSEKINLHDRTYHNHITDDTTIHCDNDSRWINYEEDIYYYEPIVPGQTTYFIIGEFEYVEADAVKVDDHGNKIDLTWGFHEAGYYNPLMDVFGYIEWLNENSGGGIGWGISPLSVETVTEQSAFWSGFYRCLKFTTKAPEKLEGDFTVDESNLKPNGGILTITPTDNISLYLCAMLDPSANELLMQTVDNSNPETIQAYLTSFHAYANFGVTTYDKAEMINVLTMINNPDYTADYTLYMIGFGRDKDGLADVTQQVMKTMTINLPDPTQPAPTIEVTAIDAPADWTPKFEYELWFNVKSPSKSAYEVRYAMNDTRSWGGSTPESIIPYYGEYFTAEEVELINSDEGFDVMFSVNPDTEYALAVIAYNDEGTASKAGYAVTMSGPEIFGEKVESPLFEELKGEWLLTCDATCQRYDYNTVSWISYEDTIETTLTIGDMTFPTSLSSEYVEAFAKSKNNTMTEQELNAELQVIQEYNTKFNSNIRKRNHILCQGFDVYPVIDYLGYSNTVYLSPADFFINAALDRYIYTSPQNLYLDSGPNWFMEVHSDGSVTVPFNTTKLMPMSGQKGFYMIGFNTLSSANNMTSLPYIGNGETGHFPVEISEDKNTITIKPLEIDGEKFFPQCATFNGVNFGTQSMIHSDIVLKRIDRPATSTLMRCDDKVQHKSFELATPASTKVNSVRAHSVTEFPKSPIQLKELKIMSGSDVKSNIEMFKANRF